CWPPLADRVSGDHALWGDDEHRLMAHIAENIDVVGAIHFGGGEGRLLGLRRCGERGHGERGCPGQLNSRHGQSSLKSCSQSEPTAAPPKRQTVLWRAFVAAIDAGDLPSIAFL